MREVGSMNEDRTHNFCRIHASSDNLNPDPGVLLDSLSKVQVATVKNGHRQTCSSDEKHGGFEFSSYSSEGWTSWEVR